MEEKQIRIEAVEWSEQAGRWLAEATTTASRADYQRQVEQGAALFRVSDADGATLCFYILRVDRYATKTVGVIVAATAKADFPLTDLLMPHIERQFIGCDVLEQYCQRPGMVKKMIKQGWEPTHIVIRKRINHG